MQSLELFRAEEIRGASLLDLIGTDIYPNLTHSQAPALCADRGKPRNEGDFSGLCGSMRQLVWMLAECLCGKADLKGAGAGQL